MNRLDIFRNPHRIVCSDNSGQVDISGIDPITAHTVFAPVQLLFDCPLYTGCNYETPSEQFHQWTCNTPFGHLLLLTSGAHVAAKDGAAFGLSFATPEEAAGFADVVKV